MNRFGILHRPAVAAATMLLPCSIRALPFGDLKIVLYSDLKTEQIGFMIRLGMAYSKGVQRQ